jgi:hypothetical protein
MSREEREQAAFAAIQAILQQYNCQLAVIAQDVCYPVQTELGTTYVQGTQPTISVQARQTQAANSTLPAALTATPEQ